MKTLITYFQALVVLFGLLGCTDAKLTHSREYVKEPVLMKGIREKAPIEDIRDIIISNPTIIKETEISYKIGPLAQALLNGDEPLVHLLINYGADPNLAIHSLSNSYPHSFSRYIGLLDTN
jgi:hypothetical protein